MHLRPLHAVVATLFAVAACSDNPIPAGGGTSDAGSDRETTHPDVHADDVTSADDATSDRDAGGSIDVTDVKRDVPTLPDGGAFSCEIPRSGGRFSLAATLPDGSKHQCKNLGGTPDLHHTVSGVVRSVTPSPPNHYAVTIDTCSGDACSAANVVFDILSTTPLVLPVGAFVEADYWIRESFACSYFLRLTNLPTFNGQANPVSDKSKIHFLASDGLFNANTPLAPLGITATPLPLGCAPDASTHFPTPVDTYVFQFSRSGEDLIVPMGESVPWTLNGQDILIRNHRSYQIEASDAYWDWVFTFEDR